jgi:hypothetical protein
MAVVVEPNAREEFTPRELADAFEDFAKGGPQYVDDETGIKASAYRYGERELLVYEEPGTALVVLAHPMSSRRSPRSSHSSIAHDTDHAAYGDRPRPSRTLPRK